MQTLSESPSFDSPSLPKNQVYGRLWPVSAPEPEQKCTGGRGTLTAMADDLLFMTGVTGLRSAVTGKTSSELSLDPNAPPVTCTPPSDDEMTKWNAQPARAATLALDKFLFRPSSDIDTARSITLQYWPRDGLTSHDHPKIIAQYAIVFPISEKIPTSNGGVADAFRWLRVRLRPGSNVDEQIANTFGPDGVDIASLEDRDDR